MMKADAGYDRPGPVAQARRRGGTEQKKIGGEACPVARLGRRLRTSSIDGVSADYAANGCRKNRISETSST
jgi:hypothetical protein